MKYSQEVLDLFNTKKVQERFWIKVNKTTNPDGCWEWNSAKGLSGHGRFKLDGNLYGPHVLSLWSHLNEAPIGRDVCHKCDNPACVNPNHLWYGTRSDNMKDAYDKGRLDNNLAKAKANHIKGEDVWSCAITEIQALEILAVRRDTGKGPKAIQKMFHGLGFKTVENLLYRKTWKHL